MQQQQSEQEGASPFSPPVVQQQQSGQEGVSPPPVVQHQEDESFVPSPPPSYDTLHDYKDSYTEPSLPPPYPGP